SGQFVDRRVRYPHLEPVVAGMDEALQADREGRGPDGAGALAVDIDKGGLAERRDEGGRGAGLARPLWRNGRALAEVEHDLAGPDLGGRQFQGTRIDGGAGDMGCRRIMAPVVRKF